MTPAGGLWRSVSVGVITFLLSSFVSVAVPPSISITNITIGSNEVLKIQAAASDPDGIVTNVEFYAAVVANPIRISQRVQLQGSPDLSRWTPLSTRTASGGVAAYLQPRDTLSNQFFRAVSLP